MKRALGFTLVELLIVLAIVAILASLAAPSFSGYIARQRVAGAQTDLVALSMNLETHLQNTTAYPDPADGVDALRAALPGWTPVQQAHFGYALTAVDNTVFPPTYSVTATGTSGALAGCIVTLASTGVRTTAGCAGSAASW